MNYRWLFRMARWAQNPPGEKRVILVLGIVAVCLIVFAVETFVGWPELLSLEPRSGRSWRP